PSCKATNGAGAKFCESCGRLLPLPSPGAKKQELESLALVVPVNTSVWAIAAGYLGLFAVLLIFAPPALFCGIMAVLSLRRNKGMRGHVRAWLGIAMGLLGTVGLGLVVWALLME